jgi:hypothetical protein
MKLWWHILAQSTLTLRAGCVLCNSWIIFLMEVQRARVKAFQAMYLCCRIGNPKLSYEHSAITKSQVLIVT